MPNLTMPGPSSHEDPEARILAPFQDVWPVTLRPKGLGRTRALGSGSYRLCLGFGLAGEYVCIEHLGMRTAIPDLPDGSLNYVDLDLVPPLEARGDAPKTRQHLHSYARIEFQNLREARFASPNASYVLTQSSLLPELAELTRVLAFYTLSQRD
ncbi:hypothetical protein CB1_001052010 [Camelus ferus]|nr:hypothetical protein CB1_001052010 [Camelus ferus]